MINPNRFIVNADGKSRRISLTRKTATAYTPKNDDTNSGVPFIQSYTYMNHHYAVDDRWAVYECRRCGLKRVFGNGEPDEKRTLMLLCQTTMQVEPHSYLYMSKERIGKASPLGTAPIGLLPCQGGFGRKCACRGRVQ